MAVIVTSKCSYKCAYGCCSPWGPKDDRKLRRLIRRQERTKVRDELRRGEHD